MTGGWDKAGRAPPFRKVSLHLSLPIPGWPLACPPVTLTPRARSSHPSHTFCRSGCLGLGEALPQWGGRGGPGPLLPGRRESKSHGVAVGTHGGSPGTYWDIAPCSTASSNTGGGGSVYTGGKGEVKTTAEAVSTPRWVHVDVKSDGSCPLYGPHAC